MPQSRHQDSAAQPVHSEYPGKEQPQWRYRFRLRAYPTRTAGAGPHQPAGPQKGQDQQASTEQAEHQHYSEQPMTVAHQHQVLRPERQEVSATSAAEHPQPVPTAAPQQVQQEPRRPT
ncbi:hypothetical protein [Mycobacteroides abscessus]|uniref:hypothetical protein n=1 Tax=Mycobacteroides abscessus TaxID=36809 RepID=UPI000941354C|nr:hypothetical protein [Mycobacteroides abscessus]